MLPTLFYEPLKAAQPYRDFVDACAWGRRIAAFGVTDGMKAYCCAALAGDIGKPIALVSTNDQQAMRLFDDLYALLGDSVVYMPARETVLYRVAAESREIAARRLTALGRLATGAARVVVMPVEAMMNPLMPPDMFTSRIFTLKTGQRADTEALLRALTDAGYERVDMVEGRGQCAMRGGILDIFPVNALNALRVEFFDDEVDTIRAFDTLTQRSLSTMEELTAYPASEALCDAECAARAYAKASGELSALLAAMDDIDLPTAASRRSAADEGDILPSLWEMDEMAEAAAPVPVHASDRLRERVDRFAHGEDFEGMEAFLPYLYEKPFTPLDYMNAPFVLMDEPSHMRERASNVLLEFAEQMRTALERFDALPGQSALLTDWDAALASMQKYHCAIIQNLETGTADAIVEQRIRFDTKGAGAYHSQMDMLASDLKKALGKGWRAALFAGGSARSGRLADTLRDAGIPCALSLREDAFVPGAVVILSEALSRGFDSVDAKLLVLSDADIFGVTKQRGTSRRRRSAGQRIDAFTDLKPGDAVVHETHGVGIYVGTERLNVEGRFRDYLHIRYHGTDKLYVPTDQLDRVQKYIGMDEGAPKLNRLGGGDWARAKQRVKQSIAAMAEDLVKLYAERQAQKGFAFSKDTPWQREFEDNFPFEETPDQLQCIQDIKRDMERTTIMDRLLCGDVGYGKTEVSIRAAFKAVMDSKQVAVLAPTTILAQQHFQSFKRRFDGFPVRVEVLSRFRSHAEQKEVLRRLAEGDVDVVVGTHRLLGKDVRYKNLGLLVVDEEQRFGVAHKEHIKTIRKNVDVLTMSATPIPRTLHMSMVGIRDMSLIETPPEERYPVQTYVVEYQEGMIRDAILREIARGGQVYFVYNRVGFIDRFHEALRNLVPEARIAVAHGQMRETLLEDVMLDFYEGRQDVLLCSTIIESGLDIPSVNTMIIYDADRFGLSQLYQLRGRVGRSNRLAYCYLTVRPNKVLSETADKRLSAIREFTDFGAGFKIAMRDMEIRGAGNILGGEQHGHMSAVGYDMYAKLMEQTIKELRGDQTDPDIDTTIELHLDAYLPQDYVRGEGVRIEVYKHIAAIDGRSGFDDVCDELIDRFGEPSSPVVNLMYISLLKSYCRKLYIEQAFLRGEALCLRFAERASVEPLRLMDALSQMGGRLQLMPGSSTLLAFKERMPPERAIVEVCTILEKVVEIVFASS